MREIDVVSWSSVILIDNVLAPGRAHAYLPDYYYDYIKDIWSECKIQPKMISKFIPNKVPN